MGCVDKGLAADAGVPHSRALQRGLRCAGGRLRSEANSMAVHACVLPQVGLRFAMRDSGRTVGAGVVTKLVK